MKLSILVTTTILMSAQAAMADAWISKDAIGCAILNETTLRSVGATGRYLDPNDPDRCRGIRIGTPVRVGDTRIIFILDGSKKRFVVTCVVPERASPPCLWVLSDEVDVIPIYRESR
jgi:hypothetical protein